MKRTAQDILNFVEDNDVKFAKLTFCDIFGNQKNVSLFASELPRAFAEGVSFDGSSIAGFMNVEESDLVLWPDPDTATVLPWRPTEGRVIRMYCDIPLPNGKPFELVFHGGSGSRPEEIAEAVSYGVIKMNIDTDTQYAFTRPIADHVFENYDKVLKIDGEVGEKKFYDPRSWGRKAEDSMSARVVEACRQLGSAGKALK